MKQKKVSDIYVLVEVKKDDFLLWGYFLNPESARISKGRIGRLYKNKTFEVHQVRDGYDLEREIQKELQKEMK